MGESPLLKQSFTSELRASSQRAVLFACCLLALLTQGPSASAQVARPMNPVPMAKTLPELIQNFEAQKGKPYIERYRYVSQFSRFRTEESARYLEKIYKEDSDANIKRSALSTLSNMRVPYARKVIAAIAQDPNTDNISLTYAIRGLANAGDLESFKILLSLLKAPPAGQVSWPARSNESRRNTDILKGLRDSKAKTKSDIIVSEVLSQAKGKLLWKKQQLLSIAATKAARSKHKEVFLKLSHEKYPELRAEAVYALDCDPLDDKIAERLIDLLSDKSPVVSTASTVVLGKHGPKAALKPLLKIAKGKNAGAAAAALEALGAYPEDKGAFSALKKAIGKKRPWQLAAAAIAGLKKRHKVDTIEVLVKALSKLDGRLLADACKALKALTGQDLGLKAKDWKNWWSAVKKGFTMPDKAALAKRKEKGPKVRNGTKSRNPSYYGSEVVSKRITFIVDFSGSMSSKVKTLEGE
ncbi:MAG: HEAT repeat domain-containing protein, partial [Planctomycetota bacterium]|nr:HEAT repeat domain-containing protein [Planctomycetota bacterium]